MLKEERFPLLSAWVSTLRWTGVSDLFHSTLCHSVAHSHTQLHKEYLPLSWPPWWSSGDDVLRSSEVSGAVTPACTQGHVSDTHLCCLWPWRHRHRQTQADICNHSFLFFLGCHGHLVFSQCFFIGLVTCAWRNPASPVTIGIDPSSLITVKLMHRWIFKVLFLLNRNHNSSTHPKEELLLSLECVEKNGGHHSFPNVRSEHLSHPLVADDRRKPSLLPVLYIFRFFSSPDLHSH